MADDGIELDEDREDHKPLLRRLSETLAERTGGEVVDDGQTKLLEAISRDNRMLRREMEEIGYRSMDYAGGNEQDMVATERRNLVQKSRIAWQRDAQLGAAVDLSNDFVLGRGVPMPRAKDKEVQKVLDEAWEDEDNKLVLTSYAAQLALNTDLTLQSNIFLLLFDDGEDGKIKVGMLDHDTVENVVRDKDNRRRVLWFVVKERRVAWDFTIDGPRVMLDGEDKPRPGTRGSADRVLTPADHISRVRYYKHWQHEADEEQTAPENKQGEGKVYHVALNRSGEMAFGHPVMHRVIRWATAFNSLMESRVDLAKAAASLIMKKKVKGTPAQVAKIAQKAMSRRSELAQSTTEDGSMQGPRSGSVITENEGVEHEAFNLNTQASNAETDGQMIKGQVSAATHWPQHYLGDKGSANLANAVAMELPVIKAVESRQEIIEQIFRWFCNQAIKKAIDDGVLKEQLSDEEMAAKQKKEGAEGTTDADTAAAETPESVPGEGPPAAAVTEAATDLDTAVDPEADDGEEDKDRKRDLNYDFGLPSPQRRMLGDLVNSVTNIAKTFDPNGTNMELSRILLAVVMGEGLEVNDPADVVDSVFPPGYKDPALAAMEQAQAAQQAPPPEAPPEQASPEGQAEPAITYGQPGSDDTPPGTPTGGPPEANPYGSMMEALLRRGESFDEEAERVVKATDDA